MKLENDAKLVYILNEIDQTTKDCPLRGEAIMDVRNFYIDTADKLGSISWHKIKSFNFQAHVIKVGELKERKEIAGRLLEKAVGIERHVYAPELNTLVFTNKIIRVPECTDFNHCIEYLTSQYTRTQLKNLIYSVK